MWNDNKMDAWRIVSTWNQAWKESLVDNGAIGAAK